MTILRVLIYPPSRRDGEVTSALLERAGLMCSVRHDALEVATEIDAGADVLIMTDTALGQSGIQQIVSSLSRQPAWSDLAVILLCQTGPQTSVIAGIVGAFTNVTVLDRPTSARTLLSTVKAALRGRLRQYQTRDQLEALTRAEAQLREADRSKDEFLAMLAHELRNPLAPIRSAADVLAQLLPDDARAQKVVAIIRRQSVQLTRLVDDLLDISRITQGRIDLKRTPVELSSIIVQALESVEPLMSEYRHKVVLAGERGNVYADGDPARLIQCVANILTNAAKYTDAGGQIHIELERRESSAAIIVTDNGTGIPADLLPRIFDLFVQSDRSLDRSQGGLGIGLSLVRRLVEMHGGSVNASSDGPGRGARFEITLPLTAVPTN